MTAASQERRRLAREVVAFDGEGTAAPDGKPQPYAVLRASDGRSVARAKGLTTREAFRFLLATAAAHEGARFVAFGISYDANQWLRDLDERRLRALWQEGVTWWKDWRIEYRPRRSFHVGNTVTGEHITIWDVQTWFGAGLLAAVDEWLPGHPDREAIAAGKRARRGFRTIAESADYTAAELRATVDLTHALLERLGAAGVRPRRLDGPGAGATALLQMHGVQDAIAHNQHVEGHARVAFAGGRQELVRHGHGGPVWRYDLNSAYPWAMADLPDLSGARWRYLGPDAIPPAHGHYSPLVLYRVRWRPRRSASTGRSPFYPFPWRARDGGMYWPSAGESWIWGTEMAAWEKVRGVFDCQVETLGAWECVPARPGARPFAFMREVYATRAALVADGDAAGGALKLAMNAAYGKLIQKARYHDQPPPFYQVEWAGMVTAAVRARLLAAAAQDPGAVVAFTQDGLITTVPLALPLGAGLGEWREERYDAVTSIQSGVYVLHRPGAPEGYTRGYDPRDLGETPAERAEALAAQARRGWEICASSIVLPARRFVSLASWVQTIPDGPRWRSWVTEDRPLDLVPTGKRVPSVMGDPARELVLTAPMPIAENLTRTPRMAAPYSAAWQLDARVDNLPDILEDEEEEGML